MDGNDYRNAATTLDRIRSELISLADKFKGDSKAWGAVCDIDWASHSVLGASNWLFKLRRTKSDKTSSSKNS